MKPISRAAHLRALRADLRYYQCRVRLDLAAARRGMQRCREIGKAMRAAQVRGKRVKS